MRYLCLEYHESLPTLPAPESAAFFALDPTQPPMTVRIDHGKIFIPDAPVAETKERLTAAMILYAAYLNHAIQLLARSPTGPAARLEIHLLQDPRPVREEL